MYFFYLFAYLLGRVTVKYSILALFLHSLVFFIVFLYVFSYFCLSFFLFWLYYHYCYSFWVFVDLANCNPHPARRPRIFGTSV